MEDKNKGPVSAEFIENEIRSIYDKWFDNAEPHDKVMRKIGVEHPEIASSYAIIIRYMIQFRTYHPDAVHEYLQYIEKNPWKNEEEYIDAQAEYPIILYRITHNNDVSERIVEELRKAIRSNLAYEFAMFKAITKKASKEVEHKEEKLQDENRNEFKSVLNNIKTKQAQNIPTDDNFKKIIDDNI
ncbi:MAG: hypothetical protein ACYCPT_03875 [Acidimicrobiales bacterium]